MKPSKIYSDYKKGLLTEQELIETLVDFAEVSYNVCDKIRCIKILDDLHTEYIGAIKLFKKFLISDENYMVRNAAAEIIPNYSLKNPKDFYQLVIDAETHIQVIATLLDSLEKLEEVIFRFALELVIKKYMDKFNIFSEEAKFFWDLDKILSKSWKDIEIVEGSLSFARAESRCEMEDSCEIPIYLLEGKNIKGLNLTCYQIRTLPDSIVSLSKLCYLNLNGVNLTKLPNSIKDLKNLKRIYLRDNHLKKIPNFLLKLAENHYAQKYVEKGVIPKEAPILGLFQMLASHKFRKETVSYNEIYERGALYYKLDNKGQIVTIGAYDHETIVLNTIPQQISILKHLEELYLWGNSISFIPESLGELDSLRILDLGGNCIKGIPVSLFLQSLETLNLQGNMIEEIPQQIVNLSSLKVLYLSSNHITEIPAKLLPFLNSLENFMIENI